MILSRAEIPPRAAPDRYAIHRALWRLFPEQPHEPRSDPEQPRQGFLFRIEQQQPGQPTRVLVQSRQPPQPHADLRLIASRAFDPRPSVGQRLAFVLTANPVKTIRDAHHADKPGKRRDTCRVPLTRETDQQQWLIRKLAGAAEIEHAVVQPHPPSHFRRKQRGGKIATVGYEGILRVTDPAALVGLLENGVGPAKGLGCGLLLVRRAPSGID
ncbi:MULTISPECIES: type I-E CRISPR-associated protein Cas6/Cse3/CasE [Marichromatium]|uniref:CRISPR-associated Cse3 family protein n=1 Tax=Marichromatium gracile TaxID=1048 RepID=A0A4R4ABH6_MARGR|nr:MULTISPECIES: type I-E CRISPR-associated protein Cas6/Cse3/CasE [Marichromatium]MBK1710321.1 type I-E CRISPR-associated protein Cas6/Cse3/CasE [Marichromatium gracile]RNE89336.1 type I-E CRISPR-associated protein Cas6/Cse3/CasE [Marichromatium sp. AB31]RNE92314.1 type I-E CRISPR-associated protein Cas6/Cse3/CasE [Marichromatium sp. AB32]TCW36368.1 CRISPR-associated Cse3 family protein [Marichromatium gracile]